MSRVSGGQKLAFKTWSTQYFNSIWVGRLFIATGAPNVMFLVPIYEPGSSCSRADKRQWLIFLLFKNTFTDKVSLLFRASILQIEEKKELNWLCFLKL